MQLELHPIVASYREMTEVEYVSLKEDIRQEGLRLPIITYQSKIIDGRHRYRACIELGITAFFSEYSGSEEGIKAFVDSLNDRRRHLSQSERAAKAVEELLPKYEAEANGRIGGRPPKGSVQIREDMTTGKAAEILAAKIGVSSAYIEKAKQLQEKNPELFEEIKRGNISIPEALRPMSHVGQNNRDDNNNEYATPAHIIDLVHLVLGEIDLDPASSDDANKIVKARNYFTIGDDGLKQKWAGRVFMNPPFSQPAVSDFVAKLAQSYVDGDIIEAITVTNNATETAWGQMLLLNSTAICLPKGRLNFTNHDGSPRDGGGALQGQMICYLGVNEDAFCRHFKSIGICFDGR